MGVKESITGDLPSGRGMFYNHRTSTKQSPSLVSPTQIQQEKSGRNQQNKHKSVNRSAGRREIIKFRGERNPSSDCVSTDGGSKAPPGCVSGASLRERDRDPPREKRRPAIGTALPQNQINTVITHDSTKGQAAREEARNSNTQERNEARQTCGGEPAPIGSEGRAGRGATTFDSAHRRAFHRSIALLVHYRSSRSI
jgi:hypothetical protein